jgi:hypothetical protein
MSALKRSEAIKSYFLRSDRDLEIPLALVLRYPVARSSAGGGLPICTRTDVLAALKLAASIRRALPAVAGRLLNAAMLFVVATGRGQTGRQIGLVRQV